jgi:hypothetical protein
MIKIITIKLIKILKTQIKTFKLIIHMKVKRKIIV